MQKSFLTEKEKKEWRNLLTKYFQNQNGRKNRIKTENEIEAWLKSYYELELRKVDILKKEAK